MAMVDAFLVKHHLKFDRNILRYMFQEADYGNEGFLTLKDLLASCQGEHPLSVITIAASHTAVTCYAC